MTESSIKKELQAEDNICFFCQQKYGETLFHIIRKSESTKWKLMKANCVLACLECHHIIDHGTNSQRKTIKNLDKILEKMKKLDEMFYNRIINKWEL